MTTSIFDAVGADTTFGGVFGGAVGADVDYMTFGQQWNEPDRDGLSHHLPKDVLLTDCPERTALLTAAWQLGFEGAQFYFDTDKGVSAFYGAVYKLCNKAFSDHHMDKIHHELVKAFVDGLEEATYAVGIERLES